jgi:hypothetical protein
MMLSTCLPARERGAACSHDDGWGALGRRGRAGQVKPSEWTPPKGDRLVACIWGEGAGWRGTLRHERGRWDEEAKGDSDEAPS